MARTIVESTDDLAGAVVDIGLPDMSGYDVARRVRERLSSAQLKLIALTGFGQPDDVEDAFAAGFDDHFVIHEESNDKFGLFHLKSPCIAL